MPTNSAIDDLEKRIDKYYEAYSAKRAVMAALLVGVVSIGLCWAVYYFSLNTFIAVGVFAVGSLLTVNVVIFVIVPPTKKLADSKKLILDVLNDPIRIKSGKRNKVALLDGQGVSRGLSRLEQAAWDSIVIPHFIKMSASGDSTPATITDEQISNTEKKVMEKRQAELIANKNELLAERQKLEEERLALDTRVKDLKKMQDQLENRVSRVEASEEDLVRLKANLQRRVEESKNSQVDPREREILLEKTAELKAKELELESAKQELAGDRDQLEAKKQQFEGMQDLLQNDAPGTDSIDSTSDAFKERELELEERLRYVASVENDLIDRLNLLSEREASVEQTEVDAGIRQD